MKIEKWIERNEQLVDSHQLFREWVEMHSTHNYWREDQASIISRVVETIDVDRPAVIDLLCGAGGLCEFLLKSLPNTKITGVDPSPFLLMICKNHLEQYKGRLSLLQGDIRDAETVERAGPFQAAVSFTSFHNLSRQSILNVYRHIYRCLPHRGIFVTGDVCTLSDSWFEGLHLSKREKKPVISMDDFWNTIKSRYGIAEEIDEMNALTSFRDTPEHGYPPSFYVNSLRWAGFEMADVVFQAENRIVYCARKR